MNYSTMQTAITIRQRNKQSIKELTPKTGRPRKQAKSFKDLKPITAVDLRKMPAAVRGRILRTAAKKAVADYLPGGSLYIEGAEDIIEY